MNNGIAEKRFVSDHNRSHFVIQLSKEEKQQILNNQAIVEKIKIGLTAGWYDETTFKIIKEILETTVHSKSPHQSFTKVGSK